MRPILRPWILLLAAAIFLVGGLFWARSQTGDKAPTDPLLEAQQQMEGALGAKLATIAGPEGGLKVEAVRKGSPADQTGMKVGDRLLSVGDRSVWHVQQLSEFVSEQLESAPALAFLMARDDEYFQIIFRRPGAHTGAPGQMPPGAAGRLPGRGPAAAPGRMPGLTPPPGEAGP
jgi:membrane-associated protease RseP (regulator of RpoE activity)